jgi:hypothetical protein
VVERLDLVPVKGKTGGDKMLSEWVTFSQISTALGKKCLGSLAIWLSIELPMKSWCKENNPGFIIVTYLK